MTLAKVSYMMAERIFYCLRLSHAGLLEGANHGSSPALIEAKFHKIMPVQSAGAFETVKAEIKKPTDLSRFPDIIVQGERSRITISTGSNSKDEQAYEFSFGVRYTMTGSDAVFYSVETIRLVRMEVPPAGEATKNISFDRMPRHILLT